MSEMSSFYGGRTGASFIIVKKFDGVDIPQPDKNGNYTYKGDFYAINKDANNTTFIVDEENKLINRTPENQKDKDKTWKWHPHDGSIANKEAGVYFPEELAEGMVQCFIKGAASTSEVNYKEYVIIDTIAGKHTYNDIDNGKVYRRGFDIQNELAGAEYIGQIVGPTGNSPDINIATENDIKAYENSRQGFYDYSTESLVPGYNSKTGEFNDKITYSWTTVRDEIGNVTECLVGFTFPIMTEELIARPVSAYYHRDDEGNVLENTELIERLDDGSHPFYQKWKISVPTGIKGDTITTLEKIDTQIKPGTPYYNTRNFSKEIGVTEDFIDIDGNEAIVFDKEYLTITIDNVKYYVPNNGKYSCTSILRYTQTNYDKNPKGDKSYIIIGDYNIIKNLDLAADGTITIDYSHDNEVILPQKIKWVTDMVIRQNGDYFINYNNGAPDIGSINFIGKIYIEKDGTVKYYYTNGVEVENLTQDKLIKWIEDVDIDDNKKLSIKYNTEEDRIAIGEPIKFIDDIIIDDDKKLSIKYNTEEDRIAIGEPIKFIEDIDIDDNKKLSIKYNTEEDRVAIGEPIKFIEDIDIDDNKKLSIKYNTEEDRIAIGDPIKFVDDVIIDEEKRISVKYNTEENRTIISEPIKFINDVIIDDTQRVSIKYNTEENRVAIGNPLNFIVEAVVTKIRNDSPLTKPYHLFVLYSAQEKRETIPANERGEYYSEVYGTVRKDWHDLGNIRGEKGGLSSIMQIPNPEFLYDDSLAKVAIPPEYLKKAAEIRKTGNYIFVEDKEFEAESPYSGWGVTYQDNTKEEPETFFYLYDYEELDWYPVSGFSGGGTEAGKVIAIEENEQIAMDALDENGVWFVLSRIKTVY